MNEAAAVTLEQGKKYEVIKEYNEKYGPLPTMVLNFGVGTVLTINELLGDDKATFTRECSHPKLCMSRKALGDCCRLYTPGPPPAPKQAVVKATVANSVPPPPPARLAQPTQDLPAPTSASNKVVDAFAAIAEKQWELASRSRQSSQQSTNKELMGVSRNFQPDGYLYNSETEESIAERLKKAKEAQAKAEAKHSSTTSLASELQSQTPTLEIVGYKCRVNGKKRRFKYDATSKVLKCYTTSNRAANRHEKENIHLASASLFRKLKKRKQFALTMRDGTKYLFSGCFGGDVMKVAEYIKGKLQRDQVNWSSFGERSPIEVVSRRRRLVERLQGF